MRVSILFEAQQANRTVAEIMAIQRAIQRTAAESTGITRLAQSLGITYRQAENLANSMGLTADRAAEAISMIRQLNSVNASAATQMQVLIGRLNITAEQFDALSAAARRADTGGGLLNVGGLGKIGASIAMLSFAYNQVTQALQSMAAAGGQAYDLLIGQNVRLRETILSMRTTIASNQDIFKNGLKIEDPKAAIAALEEPVAEAIAQLRQESLDIAGLTSQQLLNVFDVVAGNISAIGGDLQKAEKLSIAFASGLTTWKIPLFQANQEIRSILMGQVDQNSLLAKQLKITNQQINQQKQQGTLYEFLTDKLKVAVAGQDILADSFSGVTSNIQEVIENIALAAGEPLLDPIVEQLTNVYNYLKEKKDEITDAAVTSIETIQGLFNIISKAFQEIAKTLQPAITTLSEAFSQNLNSSVNVAQDSLQIFADVLVIAVKAISPLINAVAALAKLISNVLTNPLAETAATAAILTAGFLSLAPAIGAVTTAITTAGVALKVFAVYLSGLNFAGIIAGLQSATIAMGAFAGATLAAVGPWLALAAAIAPVLLRFKAEELKQANIAIEALGNATNVLSDEQIKLAQKLKALQTIEENGGKLTAEQIKLRQAYQRLLGENSQAIEAQITELKALQPANEDQKRAIEAQIALLERMLQLNSTQGNNSDIEIRSKALQELGNTYDQLKQKQEGALQTLANDAGGDIEIAKKTANELIEVIQKRRELGQITTEEAIADLQKIATNTKLPYDIQMEAMKQIESLRKTQNDLEIQALQQKQAEIQTLIKTGQLGEVEGEKQVTAAKKAELEKRLANIQEALNRENAEGRGTGTEATKLKAEAQKTANELKQLESESSRILKQARLQNFDERQKLLEADFAQRKITEAQYNQQLLNLQNQRYDQELKDLASSKAKLAETDKEGLEAIAAKEAEILKKRAEARKTFEQQELQRRQQEISTLQGQLEDAITQSEVNRQIETQRLLEQGVINQKEADQQILDSTQQRIKEQIAGQQKLISDLESLPTQSDPKKQEEIENQIRDAKIKTSQLTLDLAQSEYNQQKALQDRLISERIQNNTLATNAIVRGLETQKTAIDDVINGYDKEKRSLDAITQSLEHQSDLLNAKANLQSALNDLALSESENSLTLQEKAIQLQKALNDEKDPDNQRILEQALADLGINAGETILDLTLEKQRIEDEIADKKRKSLEDELQRQRQSLALEIKRNELIAQRALLEAKQASLQAEKESLTAQQNLEKAQTDLENAQSELERAKASGDDQAIAQAQDQVNAAQQSYDFSQRDQQIAQQGKDFAKQGEDLAQQGIEQTRELNDLQRQALEASQAKQIADLETARSAQEASQALEEVAASSSDASQSLDQVDASAASAEAVPVTSRFTGGPMTAGKPYLVGDAAGGKVTPYSEIIVPKTNSYAIAANKAAQYFNPSPLIASPSISSLSSSGSTNTNKALISEIQGLREDIKNRNPLQNNKFTFQNDNKSDNLFTVLDILRENYPF